MQTAVSSKYNTLGRSVNPENMKVNLKAIADAGITHVHWAYEWDKDYLFTDEDIALSVKMLKEYGLGMRGIHGAHGWGYGEKREGMYKWLPQAEGVADISAFDETLRKRGSALVQNRIKLAEATGTREVVLHVQIPYVRFADPAFKETYYSQTFKTLAENEQYARERGVRLCIENMVGTPNELQFDEFDRIFDRFGPDYIGYCCDTGHAMLTDANDPFSIPRKYVDRLYMIHLNDNHGYSRPGDFSDDAAMSRADEHLVLGDGTVDFDAFAEILARAPYELPVVGEFKAHDMPTDAFLTHCRERLEGFTEKVIKLRNK